MAENVAIVKTGGDDLAALRPAVRQTLDLLKDPLGVLTAESIVVIKPNITADNISWRQGVVTNPNLVQVIVELVAERNPRRILIAEAVAIGLKASKAFPFLGYDKIEKETVAKLVDLYDEPFVDVPISGSSRHQSMEVARTIVEADFLINVPVLKTHAAGGISVCMKNLMGTVSVTQKKKFHFHGVAEAVCSLNSVVRPNLSIVDGTVAGEGNGPMANDPVGFKTIIAGTDNRIVDTVAAQVMGFDPDTIDILKECNERWETLNSADIHVKGEPVDQIARSFKHAAERIEERDGVKISLGGECATCIGVIELALGRATQSGILDKIKPLHIVCGSDKLTVDRNGKVLLVGKCLSHLEDMGNYVPGCPPQAFLIADELAEMAGEDRIFGRREDYLF